MKSLSRSILRTLVYADVFSYPLTAEEIYRFLIVKETQNARRDTRYEIRNTQDDVEKELVKKSYHLSPVTYHDGFYFLKGRGKIVALRKKREQWSQEKLQIAQRIARWLKFIPWVKMVAVTGALAMKNSDLEDDIDLLIATTRNRLWLTRPLTVLLVELMARRRRPGDLPAGRQVKDKICLNMFLDEAHLRIPKKEQNLFTAHEVYQLKLLWERGGIYQKFLRANQWATNFLPNWRPDAD